MSFQQKSGMIFYQTISRGGMNLNTKTTRIAPEEIDRQRAFCAQICARNSARAAQPLAFVDTYGCQQNEADSERLRG